MSVRFPLYISKSRVFTGINIARVLLGNEYNIQPVNISLEYCVNNNNNNNNQDNVYGAVIMAEPLREFTRFI